MYSQAEINLFFNNLNQLIMDPLIGQITLTAANFAPRGWQTCDGQILQISQYSALFAILGVQFGGNGQTTFALPDLRGRVAIGSGSGPGLTPRVQGAKGGSETVTLTLPQLPMHTHVVNPGFAAAPSQATPAGNFPSNLGASNPVYGNAVGGNLGAAVVGSAGLGQPHENMTSWLCLNYMIAIEGVFPARN